MQNNLWNDISNLIYKDNKELYQNHILEQYKLYVEMADRISSRRNLANGFFLTLNTLFLTAIGFLFERISLANPKWIIIFILTGAVLICFIWWWLLKSYRDLNSAKYKVVGHLEEKLPSSPYWKDEWKELGEGKNMKLYYPLSHLEKFVPLIFGALYIMIGIYLFLNH